MDLSIVFAVTNAAIDAARSKLEKRGTPNAAVRLGVRGGGCSGYQYVIEFDDGNKRDGDTVIAENGATFFIDKKSMTVLHGSTLDYERGIIREGFKFTNPQQGKTCGCGISFDVISSSREPT